ncbi:MAG: TIM barrel protein [Rhodothermales bacterium]|nr:TIM barrel protein [Rhodothermales bacterium]
MYTRRQFLSVSAAAAVAAACQSETPPVPPAAPATTHLDRVGLGLFTIPRLLNEDFAGTLAMLAGIGYKELEFFGPYTYSVPEAHAYWNPIGEQLGIPKTGYFGHTPQEVRTLLDQHGLTSPSMHIDLPSLRQSLGPMLEAANVIGQRYAGISNIPDPDRPNLDAYKRMADEFNTIGARMQEAGVKLLYHNHGYGFAEMEGQIPMNVLLDRVDPDLVALEMDIFWTVAAGVDPVAYLEAYPAHYRLMHLKDMKEQVRFAGDGGSAPQWIELFPYIADAGSGVLDFPRILSAAKKAGVQHFYLEYDITATPKETLENSYRYLSTVELAA